MTTWVDAPGSDLDAVLGLRPDLHERWRAMERRVWAGGRVDPVILELARLRVAELLRADAQLAVRTREAAEAGLDEDLAASVSRWPRDDRFTPAMRAVLAYAETFVIDPHRLDDDDVAAVTEHLGEAGLTALTTGLALWEGIGRFERVMGVSAPTEPPTPAPTTGAPS